MFNIGDKVEKYTGDYQLEGVVVSVFQTTAGKTRYVVEHDPGFLHIYGEANLRMLRKYVILRKRLAEGCCSSSSPCDHQKIDPTTICDICKIANNDKA